MATTWTVTGDTPDQFEYAGGRDPVPGHYITFSTGEGNRGSVFVPDDHYNTASVRKIVAAKARVVDEIAILTGTA